METATKPEIKTLVDDPSASTVNLQLLNSLDQTEDKFVTDFSRLPRSLQRDVLDMDSKRPYTIHWKERDIVSNADYQSIVAIDHFGFSACIADDYFVDAHHTDGDPGDDLQYLDPPGKAELMSEFPLQIPSRQKLEDEDYEWTDKDDEFFRWIEHEAMEATPHLYDHTEALKKLDTMREYPEICLDLLKPDPRGNYTDEILEFKSTKMLLPYWPPAAERYADNTFEPDYDKIYNLKHLGTYGVCPDWSPSDPSEHSIDPDVCSPYNDALYAEA
jgi:hypothetical protein